MKTKRLAYIIFSITLAIFAIVFILGLTSCNEVTSATNRDIDNQVEVGNDLAQKQPTPTDVDYSLERYNLIKRTYWVNGMREKAMTVVCPVTKPLGYIVLFTESGTIIGQFTVDGKVSSLGSYLTPSYWYENVTSNNSGAEEIELPDVDGCYGSNVEGIFFFTTDGKYIEWTGTYLYSDIPFSIDDTLLGEY